MSYLMFEVIPRSTADFPAGSVAVLNARSRDVLGVLVYYPRWKQHVMHAREGIVWSHDCLTDVAAKLRELNATPAPARDGRAAGGGGEA